MIAGLIYEIERDLGVLLATHEAKGEVSITKTQRLDFARQSLEDCAVLLHLISAPNEHETGKIEETEAIAARLKLETTKALVRLETTTFKPVDTGEIDFF
jgi:hypothetical protein